MSCTATDPSPARVDDVVRDPVRADAGRATTRRTALGLAGGATLGLAGCRFDPADDPAASGSTTQTPTSSPGAEATADPDQAAVDAAVATTTDLLDVLAAGGPALDPSGRLTALHTAHLAVLTAAGPTPGASATPPPGGAARPRAVTRLRRREVAAQRQLAALARTAESGALARLLASMSAGIAAHLAVSA